MTRRGPLDPRSLRPRRSDRRQASTRSSARLRWDRSIDENVCGRAIGHRRICLLRRGVATPHTDEMWNSNSVTAWALTRSGVDTISVQPPGHGLAPVGTQVASPAAPRDRSAPPRIQAGPRPAPSTGADSVRASVAISSGQRARQRSPSAQFLKKARIPGTSSGSVGNSSSSN